MSGGPRPRRRAPAKPVRGALRVVTGDLRGRRFDVPGGDATRPTGDRVREATFGALGSLGAIDGARVLDAFAGSGALGIEALSRGAAHVTFAETDRAALDVLRTNLTTLDLRDRSTVAPVDGVRASASGGPWDLVLLDPPYAFERWDDLLDGVAAALAPDGVVVVESDREVALPAGLATVRVRRYGSTVVAIASPTGDPGAPS